MNRNEDRTRKRVKTESVIRTLADAEELNSRCHAERAAKERKVTDLNSKLERAFNRKVAIRNSLGAQKVKIDQMRLNIDLLQTTLDDTEKEYDAVKQEIEEVKVEVKEKTEELHWSAGICEASDAFLDNFQPVKEEEEEAVQQTSSSSSDTTQRSYRTLSSDTPQSPILHENGDAEAKRVIADNNGGVTAVHKHAAEMLGVILLGGGHNEGTSKPCALEHDLEWYHITTYGKNYSPMKSYERPVDVFLLLRMVLSSGGFESFCRGTSELSWNMLCVRVGINTNSKTYLKKWYKDNVHGYELLLLDKVRKKLARAD